MFKVIKSTEERFWEKVKVTESGCWEWQAWLDFDGYGQFRPYPSNRKRIRAHAYSFYLAGGRMPDGFVLDHLCQNRRCVNPAHLKAVTPRENVMRSNGVAAKNARVTHCPKGHPYDLINTYYHHGKRNCRICMGLRNNNWARRTLHESLSHM